MVSYLKLKIPRKCLEINSNILSEWHLYTWDIYRLPESGSSALCLCCPYIRQRTNEINFVDRYEGNESVALLDNHFRRAFLRKSMACEMLLNLLPIHILPGLMHLLDQFSIICELRVVCKVYFCCGITSVFALIDEKEGEAWNYRYTRVQSTWWRVSHNGAQR